ncbi:F390 synthetase-related protein [Brevibacillus borstelensis]|uniref:F390 synthetase-related protein n=1 Tax=Brevibacillus borstelensis TaxID=45462 RepID=UPI0030C3CA65
MELIGTLGQYIQTKRLAARFHTRQELAGWQEKQVQKLLRYVLPRSPFYRERLGSVQLDEWRTMAPIEKREMMEHFDRLNTAGIKRDEALRVAEEAEETRDFTLKIGEVTVGLSSGTSGSRGIFLVGPKERVRWAGAVLAKALPGPLWEKQRVAFFLRANSNLYTSVKRKRLQFAFFDLLISPEEHVARLQEYQPTILVAPPSMLRLLAVAKQEGSFEIRPDKVISVAEVLDPIDEEVIRQAFGGPVHQIYQCTEGFLAATCEHGTLHVNEDILVMEKEYLDETKTRFHPIITDFSRYTQPMIRYRLNDVLTERKTPCPCGSVFLALEQIEGRADDVFYFPSAQDAACSAGSGEKLGPFFPDFVRRAVMTASPGIEEYIVRQKSPEQVEVSLVISPAYRREDAEEEVRRKLRREAERQGYVPPAIAFAPYQPPERGRKLRRVERMFQPDER